MNKYVKQYIISQGGQFMKRNLAIILIISLSMVGCSQSKHSEEVSFAKSVVQYGITAEVTEFLEDRQYKVETIGGDENFVIGDIVIVNCDYTAGKVEQDILKTGDIIAITYSEFEKTDTGNKITHGQIEVITS